MYKQIGGHIFGKDLNELRFIFDSLQKNGEPTPIELGEILVVEDKASKSRFLVRVTNIEYGQNQMWSKEVARGYNRMQHQNEFTEEHENPFDIYKADRDEQLFHEAVCEILGLIDAKGNFTSPKRLPSYFSYTRKLETADFEMTAHDPTKSLKDKLGDIQFGNIRSGSEVLDIGGGVFKEMLAKHIGVFAQTGGGKSNTMQMFISKTMELKGQAGMLVFDPHGEYIQELPKHPLSDEQLVSFAQEARGDGSRKLRISYSDINVAALMNVKDQLNWTDAQERFLREAEAELREKDPSTNWLWQLLNLPINDDENDELPVPFPYTLQRMFKDYKEDTIKATRSKLRQIKDASYLVEDDTVSNINEIMSLIDQGKIVLIDMASLSGLHEILLSTILATKALNRRRFMYSKQRESFKDIPPVAIVMEEAQRVLGKQGNNSSNIFAQICNEGRKFKTGLIAITQQPKLMNDVLISQFNTLIILSISDEKDFGILSGISKKPIDKLRREIRSLMPGEAIVTSPLSPFAVPLKISFYPEYLRSIKHKFKKKNAPSKNTFKGF